MSCIVQFLEQYTTSDYILRTIPPLVENNIKQAWTSWSVANDLSIVTWAFSNLNDSYVSRRSPLAFASRKWTKRRMTCRVWQNGIILDSFVDRPKGRVEFSFDSPEKWIVAWLNYWVRTCEGGGCTLESQKHKYSSPPTFKPTKLLCCVVHALCTTK